MNTKGLARVEVKDAEKGEVTAVFATLDVIDSDRDVTVKGAFPDGAQVAISAYGHKSWEGVLPVGLGTIREVGNEAILEGRFFMDTSAGKDTFATVKALGEAGLQEWSYGYDPVKSEPGTFQGQKVRFLRELKVYEVSPVLRGAGVGTRLVAAKSGMKFEEHIDAVVADVEGLQERAAEVMALRSEKGKSLSEGSIERLRRVVAAAKALEDAITTTPSGDTADPAFVAEWLRYVAHTQGVTA